MPLKAIGAGLFRTGTNSLQLALEQLLGGRCYHMNEVFERPGDAPVWQAAMRGELPDWDVFLGDYVAAVDWPASACWESLAATYPDAPVILSTRRDPEQWWQSAIRTVVPATINAEDSPWQRMAWSLFENFRGNRDIENREPMIAAYHAHIARVRAVIPAARLVEWQPEDGWGPLCEALGMPVPDEAFPRVNTREEFQRRIGAHDPAPGR